MIKIISCDREDDRWIATVESHNLYIDGKGGQVGDQGFIGDVKFLTVLDEKRVVVEKEISTGSYPFLVDQDRVHDIAVQHTAQHLFSGIAFNNYSFNTVGFRMTETYTTVDLDTNLIDDNLVAELEKEINKAITLGAVIKENILTREEAEKIERFRKKISDKVKGAVRVIEIDNIDIGACAGYHVKNISEIKLFKIINFEKIKGNFTRLYFLAGERAIADYSFKNTVIKELNKKFSCRDYEILSMVEKFNEEKKNIETSLKNLRVNYSQFLAKDLIEKAIKKDDLEYIIYSDEQEIIESLSKIIPLKYVFIGVWKNGGLVSTNSLDCGIIIKKLVENFSIKGFGKQNKGNFKGEIDYTNIVTYFPLNLCKRF